MDKRLENATVPFSIKLCPSMDLVAVASSRQLDVFRFDGQRAFSRTRSDTHCMIDSVAWLANGSGISIIWDDELVDVVDSAQGRLVRQAKGRLDRRRKHASSTDPSSKPRRSVGHSWAVNLVQPDAFIRDCHTSQETSALAPFSDNSSEVDQVGIEEEDETHLEQFFERVPNNRRAYAAADLPSQLALLDAAEELPRLSPLPHADDGQILGFAPDALCTQAGVEEAIYTANPRNDYNKVDVMSACWNDRTVTLSYDGVISESGSDLTNGPVDQIIGQASHPLSSCHAVVSRHDDDRLSSSSLELIALNGLHRTGHLFNVIVPKVNALKHLSQYVVHCVAATRDAWNTSQALPQRFISSISDELAKREQTLSVEVALTHQAVTGSILPEVREWLSEEVQERGHKRWDAAVVNGYSHIIDLVHTHLLPALDHASIVASQLRGLSRMEPPVPPMKIPSRNLSRILTDLDNLRLISHRVLEYAGEELCSFRVFSTWLQLQITITRAEPNSTAANDAAEKAAGVDCGLLLPYIEGPLRLSQLNYILGRSSEEISEALRRPGDQLKKWLLIRILEKHDKEAMQPKQRQDGGSVEAVNALWQALMLRDGIDDVVDASHEGFRKGMESTGRIILGGRPIALQTDQLNRIGDVRMIVENPELDMMCSYFIDAIAASDVVRLHRVVHHRFLDDISDTIASTITGTSRPPGMLKVIKLITLEMQLPRDGVLIAFRFLTDDVMLVLSQPNSSISKELELHWAFYGAGAGMTRDATGDSAEPQVWTPSWKQAKRWDSQGLRDFVPAIGSLDLRLALPDRVQMQDPGDMSNRSSRRVVFCMLDGRGERYRIEEAEIVL